MQIQAAGNGPTGKLTETISLESTTNSAGLTESKPAQTSYSPTADLAKLLASVKEFPDVREDAIAEATARIESGELFSPQSANETAIAALDDLR
jgi:hypothetical protein